MKVDQHPFPTNIVEVSSRDISRTKSLTSKSAQNKGVVYPKVHATAADVKGKGYCLKKKTQSHTGPSRPVC
jgi:hypothetical protein